MFYLLSKILGFFVLPSNALAAMVLAGACLAFTRFARLGRSLALLAGIGLVLCGLGPVGNIAIGILEDRFPPPAADAPPPDGIIVLGGGVEDRLSGLRGGLQLNEAGDRVAALLDLARRYPQARLVYSGGTSTLLSTSPVREAELVEAAAVALGLPPGRLVIEAGSRNTAENARFSAELARPGETWWLVTSAFHMPRAIGVFRAQGFEVTAYPVDYRTGGEGDRLRLFASVSEGLRRTDVAAREWIGLIAYRLTGRTSALLPRP